MILDVILNIIFKVSLVFLVDLWTLLSKGGHQVLANIMPTMQPLTTKVDDQDQTDLLTFHKYLRPCKSTLITQVTKLIK